MELLPDSIDFDRYLRETDARANVKPASVWTTELVNRLRNPDTTKKVYLPWERARDVFVLRPGEVSLWAGQNGHGKTQIASQITLSLMGQGEKVVIASFEMKPATTMQRLARMYAGTNPFSPEYQQADGVDALESLYREFGDWTDGRLWLYDQTGTVDAARVIAMARYCAKELGISHIVIDSLMKCVRGEDDYNGQKAFVDELTALARDNAVHVHLLHHLRKPTNASAPPSPAAARSSA